MSSERAKEIRKNVLPHNNHKKGIKTRSKNIPENDFESKRTSSKKFCFVPTLVTVRKNLLRHYLNGSYRPPEFYLLYELAKTRIKKGRKWVYYIGNAERFMDHVATFSFHTLKTFFLRNILGWWNWLCFLNRYSLLQFQGSGSIA